MTEKRYSVPIKRGPACDDVKLKVSIETRNGVKYFTMTLADFDDMMYQIDSHRDTFINIPGSKLFINIDQIIYIYPREIKEGESL